MRSQLGRLRGSCGLRSCPAEQVMSEPTHPHLSFPPSLLPSFLLSPLLFPFLSPAGVRIFVARQASAKAAPAAGGISVPLPAEAVVGFAVLDPMFSGGEVLLRGGGGS